jgi:SAM-dependent methyltransferase
MQLQRTLLSLVTTVSLGSFMLSGCSSSPTTNTQTQEPAANTPAQQPAANTPAQQPAANTQTETPTLNAQTPKRAPDVVYVPTPEAVVEKMLELGKVTKNDVLYDLGSGDGRIVVTAAQKFGTQGTGIEIRPDLIKEANSNAQQAGVTDRVKFLEQDLFQTDLSKATVITLYLLPDLNLKLRPTLLKLKPGTRIVSHDFNMGDWKPDQVVEVKGPSRSHTVYLWTVPEKIPENLKG